MKISLYKGNILIISDKLVSTISKLSGLGNRAMGVAVFPCLIILRNLTHPMTEQWINHERIHHNQTNTTLGISFFISMVEYWYARLILKYTHVQAYRYESIEQEAYLNQSNPEYLRTRAPWSIIKYIKHKTVFHTDENSHVVIDKT